ncbi:hypothetical protein BKA70DRAFT_1426909 [Coprinopsis sp. MPI-PUGE-AT-0042]|nr:hypothetical protein BKA70DRAFT_1426909 [Coprinopsis sp. MPI-PUGE-AT-0042]
MENPYSNPYSAECGDRRALLSATRLSLPSIVQDGVVLAHSEAGQADAAGVFAIIPRLADDAAAVPLSGGARLVAVDPPNSDRQTKERPVSHTRTGLLQLIQHEPTPSCGGTTSMCCLSEPPPERVPKFVALRDGDIDHCREAFMSIVMPEEASLYLSETGKAIVLLLRITEMRGDIPAVGMLQGIARRCYFQVVLGEAGLHGYNKRARKNPDDGCWSYGSRGPRSQRNTHRQPNKLARRRQQWLDKLPGDNVAVGLWVGFGLVVDMVFTARCRDETSSVTSSWMGFNERRGDWALDLVNNAVARPSSNVRERDDKWF